jgi:hypothetical protein
MKNLPLTQDLVFLKYDDEKDGNDVEGFIFYYPDFGNCFVIECEYDQGEAANSEQRVRILEFEKIMT